MPKICNYRNYNYQKEYWEKVDRRYEHAIETATLKKLLEKIPPIKKLIDIGCGFGRLYPVYQHKAEKIILFDYCQELLDSAKNTIGNKKNIEFIQGNAYEMPFKNNTIDLGISIRTLHHFIEPEKFIKEVKRILKPGGYFIFEIPNKRNFKQILKFLFLQAKTNPFDEKKYFLNEVFVNYHPNLIKRILKENGFTINQTLNTSFLRIGFVKKFVPLPILMKFELFLQKYFSFLNLSPSIYVLCNI